MARQLSLPWTVAKAPLFSSVRHCKWIADELATALVGIIRVKFLPLSRSHFLSFFPFFVTLRHGSAPTFSLYKLLRKPVVRHLFIPQCKPLEK